MNVHAMTDSLIAKAWGSLNEGVGTFQDATFMAKNTSDLTWSVRFFSAQHQFGMAAGAVGRGAEMLARDSAGSRGLWGQIEEMKGVEKSLTDLTAMMHGPVNSYDPSKADELIEQAVEGLESLIQTRKIEVPAIHSDF